LQNIQASHNISKLEVDVKCVISERKRDLRKSGSILKIIAGKLKKATRVQLLSCEREIRKFHFCCMFY
jgi:hypothetical protein